jgi:hypothetical protein
MQSTCISYLDELGGRCRANTYSSTVNWQVPMTAADSPAPGPPGPAADSESDGEQLQTRMAWTQVWPHSKAQAASDCRAVQLAS